MKIYRCALGVILGRGERVIEPALSALSSTEEDFLNRHIVELRARDSGSGAVTARFRVASTKSLFVSALTCTDDQFVGLATVWTQTLAAQMKQSARAKEDCVVALIGSGSSTSSGAEHITYLKLDAQLEAARLELLEGGGAVRLEVFKDLLPAPGDLQKGASWPDTRAAHSDVIFHDTNQGNAALYFANALGLAVSSKSLETEKDLVSNIVEQLGPVEAATVIAVVSPDGGRADEIVATIRASYPSFEPSARSLGVDGIPAGIVRPRQLEAMKHQFIADGIELKVPVNRLGQVQTTVEGDGYVTTVRTSTPLTRPEHA